MVSKVGHECCETPAERSMHQYRVEYQYRVTLVSDSMHTTSQLACLHSCMQRCTAKKLTSSIHNSVKRREENIIHAIEVIHTVRISEELPTNRKIIGLQLQK